jgi:hypothetical protein
MGLFEPSGSTPLVQLISFGDEYMFLISPRLNNITKTMHPANAAPAAIYRVCLIFFQTLRKKRNDPASEIRYITKLDITGAAARMHGYEALLGLGITRIRNQSVEASPAPRNRRCGMYFLNPLVLFSRVFINVFICMSFVNNDRIEYFYSNKNTNKTSWSLLRQGYLERN